MRPAASLGRLTSSIGPHVEMKGAVDRRAVAGAEFARSRSVIIEGVEDFRGNAAGQQALVGGSAENHPRAGTRGAPYLGPERGQGGIVHPVLGIEQNIGVEALRWLLREYGGQRAMIDAHSIGACPQGFEVVALEIGRQTAVARQRIAASKRLPGKVVFPNRKVASQPLDASFQDRGNAVGPVPRERTILGRRNSKAIERRGTRGEPLHESLFKQRRDLLLEGATLLIHRFRRQHGVESLAVQTGDEVTGADETPQQSMAVEVAREGLDMSSPIEAARIPRSE